MKDPKTRFSDRADVYKKYRPLYPREAVEFVKTTCAFDDNCAIADIGSGTGISTEILITVFNCPVFAVEPNRNMRTEAEKMLGSNPLFRSVNGSSENTSLPDNSVNLVSAFQAFHWFEKHIAKQEFRRILKQPGWVLLVWNDRITTGTPFIEGYDELLKQLPEYQSSNHKSTDIDDIMEFIGTDDIQTAEFPNAQTLNLESLKGRFFSSSYTPAYGTDEYNKQIVKLEKLFGKTNTNGMVSFLYNTQVFLGKMKR